MSVERADAARRRRSRGPLLLVAFACAFTLVAAARQTSAPQPLNDSAVHEQMVRWAEARIEAGHLPLDGWYPYLQLGSARFHNYQSLPHILTGSAATVVGASAAYRWSLYLLLSLWPIAVYAGARLLGLGRWQAGAAALVSPLIHSEPSVGFEHASYVWQGWGVWSQLWAMWFLPLSLGLTWRAVRTGRGYAIAALLLSLTITSHLMMGYLAILALGVWVVIAPRELWRRLGRAVIVGAGGLLTASWLLVPLLSDRQWTTQSVFLKDAIFTDSFGPVKVLGWLFTGQIFDRPWRPVVTIMALVGIVVLARRWRRERSRALLGFFLMSLLLFFGRSVVGPVVELLPGGEDLLLRRTLAGVQMAGILLAGVGGVTIWRGLVWVARRRLAGTRAVVAAGVAAGLLLSPAWVDRGAYHARGAQLMAFQERSEEGDAIDAVSLITRAKQLGGGRFYAGLRSNWGARYEIGLVPLYAVLANQDADAIGFTLRTPSISTDMEARFNETLRAHYELFNVRYLLQPEDRQPRVEATLLQRAGRHALWEVATSGYLQVVDTAPPIVADRETITARTTRFLASQAPLEARYPTLAYGGREAAPSSPGGEGSPGEVLGEASDPEDGVFEATIEARRPAVVVLKASFDPRWRATVDGDPVPTQMIAPSYVGVPVPAGEHRVAFAYQAYPHYAALLALVLIAQVALALVPRLTRRH